MSIGDPNEETLWEGVSQTITGAATKGRGATRYRLTPWHLYHESGLLSTNSQSIPLQVVVDADLRQTLTQKARGIGDVVLHLAQPGGAAGANAWAATFTIAAVKDPQGLQTLLRQTVAAARQAAQRSASTQFVHHQGTPPSASAAPSGGLTLAEQLQQLAALRDQGILTEDEFAAQKTKLLS